MMQLRAVSIVIPAHDEAERLPATMARIRDFAAAHPGIVVEIVVVDDGSKDSTAAVARRFPGGDLPVRVISYAENGGKGYAVRRGALVAHGEWILVSDADGSTPIEEIAAFENAAASAAIIIGSRALDESRIEVRQGRVRQSMGKIFNGIVRLLTGIPFHDTQCGFKLIRRDAARRIFSLATVDRFAWDVELLILARRLGYDVAEVPVRWLNSPDSRVHIVRDSLRMLLDVLAIRRRAGSYRSRPFEAAGAGVTPTSRGDLS